jgi:hypothetical protein
VEPPPPPPVAACGEPALLRRCSRCSAPVSAASRATALACACARSACTVGRSDSSCSSCRSAAVNSSYDSAAACRSARPAAASARYASTAARCNVGRRSVPTSCATKAASHQWTSGAQAHQLCRRPLLPTVGTSAHCVTHQPRSHLRVRCVLLLRCHGRHHAPAVHFAPLRRVTTAHLLRCGDGGAGHLSETRRDETRTSAEHRRTAGGYSTA